METRTSRQTGVPTGVRLLCWQSGDIFKMCFKWTREIHCILLNRAEDTLFYPQTEEVNGTLPAFR